MVNRAAIIEDGVVVNITLAEAEFATEQGWIITEEAEIGDLWDGEAFTSPPPPEAPPPSVPAAVTARQARLVLLGAGLLDDVEQLLNNMAGAQGEAARIEWEYALEIRRDSPLVQMLAPMLNLTGEQVDAMFVQAVTL